MGCGGVPVTPGYTAVVKEPKPALNRTGQPRRATRRRPAGQLERRRCPSWLEAVSALEPEEAAKILRNAVPAPPSPPSSTGTPTPPQFLSWEDFITRTTSAERRAWCARKTKVANRPRLVSDSPDSKITAKDVWKVLAAARGRCAYCQSLAVEQRPSRHVGAPVTWESAGRRIDSLSHRVIRFHGGPNTLDNLAWSCLWRNTWPDERLPGATDHGGHFPAIA
jgi:hypothetical protein